MNLEGNWIAQRDRISSARFLFFQIQIFFSNFNRSHHFKYINTNQIEW